MEISVVRKPIDSDWFQDTALLLVALGCTQSPGAADAQEHSQEREVREWVENWGDRWWERYHPDYVAFSPGGRSNSFHDQYIQKVMRFFPDNQTENWKFTGKQYIYDRDWFAAEWFFESTFVASGAVQKESTLAIGRIEDGQLREWIEYFDDMVGEYQRLGVMPLYNEDETPFPWPENAPMNREYRP